MLLDSVKGLLLLVSSITGLSGGLLLLLLSILSLIDVLEMNLSDKLFPHAFFVVGTMALLGLIVLFITPEIWQRSIQHASTNTAIGLAILILIPTLPFLPASVHYLTSGAILTLVSGVTGTVSNYEKIQDILKEQKKKETIEISKHDNTQIR